MERFLRTIGVMILVFIALFVPTAIAHALGHTAAAGALVLPVAAGLVPALIADMRTSLLAAFGVSIASGAAAATSGNALAGALVMAATAFLTGLACRWGRSKTLIVVIITVGFVICQTPAFVSEGPANALILGVASLVAALWGVVIGRVVHHFLSRLPQPTMEPWARTLAYAITLALLTSIAAFISVSIDWGHAGAWFILTVVVVFQPYLQDSFKRTWQRTAGTLLGLVIASAIHSLVPWQPVVVVMGILLMLIATYLLLDPSNPYWLYAALLTPSIVLLVAPPENFDSTWQARLIATLAGVALSFVAAMLLAPIYGRVAKKHGVTHY